MDVKKIIILGNSGSGKSTFAKQLVDKYGLAHFDLDTVAWKPKMPPEREELAVSLNKMMDFIDKEEQWVIEGCYSDLLEKILDFANELIFLDLSVAKCIANAQMRPWEPHKYESKQAQDANLKMLIDWISDYEIRDDEFSLKSHSRLYEGFKGKKSRLHHNTKIKGC